MGRQDDAASDRTAAERDAREEQNARTAGTASDEDVRAAKDRAAGRETRDERETREAREDALEPGDYDGKQHYPKALYGKYADGTIVVEKVASKEAHDKLLETRPDLGWAESPADHGLETAPAGTPIESQKHPGIVGKADAETGAAETVAQRDKREALEAEARKRNG